MINTLFKGLDNAFSKLIKDAQPWFSQHSSLIDWGPTVTDLAKKENLIPTVYVFAEVSLSAPVTRLLLIPKLTDQACNAREFSEVTSTTTATGIKIGTSRDGICFFYLNYMFLKCTFDFLDIKHFTSTPLDGIIPQCTTTYTVQQTRRDQGLQPIDAAAAFDTQTVKSHARSHVSQSLLTRMQHDQSTFATMENSASVSKMLKFLSADIQRCIL